MELLDLFWTRALRNISLRANIIVEIRWMKMEINVARNFIGSGIKGVRFRQHETRKHGKQKDKYFFIRYSINGKKKQEAVG